MTLLTIEMPEDIREHAKILLGWAREEKWRLEEEEAAITAEIHTIGVRRRVIHERTVLLEAELRKAERTEAAADVSPDVDVADDDNEQNPPA